jgi:hypothetical protein
MGQVRHGYQYHIGDFPGAELSRNGNGTVSTWVGLGLHAVALVRWRQL